MTTFACATCGAVLTAPLTRVSLPDHATQKYGHGLLGTLMEPGTYAVRTVPFGPPWRRWDVVGDAEAERRGWYAPMFAISEGPAGTAVIAPGDVRGTTLIPDRLDGYCCGVDGRDGPNLACESCGTPVATRVDDCGHWQAIWLDPRVTRRIPGPAGAAPPTSWAALRVQRSGMPMEEPWGWHPFWSAAAAVSLVHLLVASGGRPVTVPDGPIATVFRRSLDLLLPGDDLPHSRIDGGGGPRTLGLAGPGLPAAGTGLALVPRHPETGDVWRPPAPVVPIPLAYDAWHHLAFHVDHRPLAGLDVAPPEAHGREPLPAHFYPDRDIFRSTLARLPEVRRPWLRRIFDESGDYSFGRPFW